MLHSAENANMSTWCTGRRAGRCVVGISRQCEDNAVICRSHTVAACRPCL